MAERRGHGEFSSRVGPRRRDGPKPLRLPNVGSSGGRIRGKALKASVQRANDLAFAGTMDEPPSVAPGLFLPRHGRLVNRPYGRISGLDVRRHIKGGISSLTPGRRDAMSPIGTILMQQLRTSHVITVSSGGNQLMRSAGPAHVRQAEDCLEFPTGQAANNLPIVGWIPLGAIKGVQNIPDAGGPGKDELRIFV